MGSHHIIALSVYYEMFSWGRNDEGQLGLGHTSRPIHEPTIIESMLDKRIKSVHASENFSACLSVFGVLYTCGGGEFGKLGTGVSKESQIDFEEVNTEGCPIVKVGLGIHHMGAIVDYDISDKENKEK